MTQNYEIAGELRNETLSFLENYGNYKDCLEILKNEEKKDFSEDEINMILNLLGTFRMGDVYHVVEKFRVGVTALKPQTNEQPESGKAE